MGAGRQGPLRWVIALGPGAPIGWPGADLDGRARRAGARAHPLSGADRLEPEPGRPLGRGGGGGRASGRHRADARHCGCAGGPRAMMIFSLAEPDRRWRRTASIAPFNCCCSPLSFGEFFLASWGCKIRSNNWRTSEPSSQPQWPDSAFRPALISDMDSGPARQRDPVW